MHYQPSTFSLLLQDFEPFCRVLWLIIHGTECFASQVQLVLELLSNTTLEKP